MAFTEKRGSSTIGKKKISSGQSRKKKRQIPGRCTDKAMIRDRDIREPLFDFLEERYGKIRVIEEKTMGRSRADAVMVMPERLVGIEIKSDADTYARLGRQVKDYERYFDANMIVVGSTHALHVGEHVPETWGIVSVELMGDALDFYVVREMKANPGAEMIRKLDMLWRPELASIQRKNGLPAYQQKSRDFVRRKIAETVPAELLHRQVSEELFERDYTLIQDEIRRYKREKGGRRR